MSQPSLTVIDNEANEVSKEQYVINYLKSMIALEEAMAPYKEQKKEFVTNMLKTSGLLRMKFGPQ